MQSPISTDKDLKYFNEATDINPKRTQERNTKSISKPESYKHSKLSIESS